MVDLNERVDLLVALNKKGEKIKELEEKMEEIG